MQATLSKLEFLTLILSPPPPTTLSVLPPYASQNDQWNSAPAGARYSHIKNKHTVSLSLAHKASGVIAFFLHQNTVLVCIYNAGLFSILL